MTGQCQHRAPLTLALVLQVTQTLSRLGLTQDEFREAMNEFLPSHRRIKGTHSGAVQLNRWLNPTSNDWCEPRGEIVLAMAKAVRKLEKNS